MNESLRFIALLLLTTALSVLAISGSQAATMEYENRPATGGDKKEAGCIFFGSDAVRVDNNDSDTPSSVIYQAETDVLLMLDHKNKTYTQTTKAELDKLAQKTSEALSAIDKQMASLPPEQRAAVQSMMGSQLSALKQPQPTAKLTWKKAASGEKISDWTCDRYEGRKGESLEEEVWTTPVASLGIPTTEMQTFQNFTAFFSDVFSKFLQGVGSHFPAFSNLKLEKDDGFDGFPVKSVSYKDGKASEIWQVTRLDNKPVAVTKFALPDGYKKEVLAVPGQW
ncbi:MAG: DUF4412 domain-containing protein [Methylacidiphilales bacterium]|nr:DUF4412 domain-containing protein [Candidatus Methylacidiphilales bacterium]